MKRSILIPLFLVALTGALVRAQSPAPGAATREQPFVNSIGMKFVPVAGLRAKVLFSVWETRVKDFEAFVKESGHAWRARPPFTQTPDDPVVMVSWDDAAAFCAWLSKKEGVTYRLPTDEEWDAAVGADKYPWGNDAKPPTNAGNFAGSETRLRRADDPRRLLEGWRDAHPRTAPVGSYPPNGLGLHDISGNVWEWCDGWYTDAMYRKHLLAGGQKYADPIVVEFKKGNVRRYLRGGSMGTMAIEDLLSACRIFAHIPANRDWGFRCVLVP